MAGDAKAGNTKAVSTPDVSAWPGLELGEPLTGGARNPAYRGWYQGKPVVVRRSGRSAGSLGWELDLLAHLRAHGVRVPREIPTQDGRRHDRGTLVQEFLPGHPPGAAADWLAVVGVLRTVHSLTQGWPQRPGFASARDLLTRTRGGDVDLGRMPADAVAAVRAAWLPVLSGPESAIHADVGAGNILVSDGQVALLDWDEARVDVAWFDFAPIPAELDVPAPCDRAALVTAGVAWETATCWVPEPEYAARRLAELFGRLGSRPTAD
jgi:Ser/Thr protein kinase RdoA (MazF antagonist)